MYLPWWWLAQGSIFSWLYIHTLGRSYPYFTEYQIYSLFCFLNDFLTVIKLLLQKYIMIHLPRQEACAFMYVYTFTIDMYDFQAWRHFFNIRFSRSLYCGVQNNNIFCSTKEIYIFVLNWERSFRLNYKKNYELPWM